MAASDSGRSVDRSGDALVTNAKVHQPAAQVGAVHPAGHGAVMALGNQQGEAEIVQQAFGSPLPRRRFCFDLDQLSGKGHIGFVDLQGLTEHPTDADLFGVDVAAPLAQRFQFRGQFFMLLLQPLQLDGGLGVRVLKIGFLACQVGQQRVDAVAVFHECVDGQYPGQVGLLRQVLVAPGARLAPGLAVGFLTDLRHEALNAVASVFSNGLFQLVPAPRLLAVLQCKLCHLLAQQALLIAQIGQAPVQQIRL